MSSHAKYHKLILANSANGGSHLSFPTWNWNTVQISLVAPNSSVWSKYTQCVDAPSAPLHLARSLAGRRTAESAVSKFNFKKEPKLTTTTARSPWFLPCSHPYSSWSTGIRALNLKRSFPTPPCCYWIFKIIFKSQLSAPFYRFYSRGQPPLSPPYAAVRLMHASVFIYLCGAAHINHH